MITIEMGRNHRPLVAGAYYHVISRGTAQQAIFLDCTDRRNFLRILSDVIREQGWECHAYCLLDNHYHLFIHTPTPTLALGMKYLNGVYSGRFNARHGRTGHLFQGRYTSRLVENDSYYLGLVRYIAWNPVRAGLCNDVQEWEWSSYRGTAGFCARPSFLNTDLVLGMFSDDCISARKAFIQFITDTSGEDAFSCGIAPGSHLNDESKELRPLSALIKHVEDKNKRDQEIIDAYAKYGYTMTEIADHLGLHLSRISRIINRTMKS